MIPYIIDNFRGGISDEFDKGVAGSFKFGYGLDIHKRRDSLSANYAMTTIHTSSAVTDLIRYTVNARDGTTYCFGSTGSIYALSGNPQDPVLTFVYNDENGEIKGAAEWAQSDLSTYLYWATATSLARVKMDGSIDTPWAAGVATQDYKTTLDNADYHTMKNAGGQLNIANKNFLASVDYQGNFNNASLNVRPGNIIKCLEERDDFVILGSERQEESEEGHLWAWVVTDLNWFKKKKIPVKGVNALIDTERLILQGGADGEVYYSDFANTSPLNSIPDGGKVNPQGVGILNDLAIFGIYEAGDNSGIYSYGRRMINRPFALNYEFKLEETRDGNTLNEIGAVWVTSSAAFASWKAGDSYYGIDMLSTSTRASARYEGLEFDGDQPHLSKEFFTEKVIMEPLPSGTSLSVIFKTDRATTSGDESGSQGAGWRYARVGGGNQTSFSTVNATEAEFTISGNNRVYEIGLELEPSGSSTPEVVALVGYLGNRTKEHG